MHYRSNDTQKYRVSSRLRARLTFKEVFKVLQMTVYLFICLVLFYSKYKIDLPQSIANKAHKTKEVFYSVSNTVYKQLHKLDLGVSDYITLKSKYQDLQAQNNILKVTTNKINAIENENYELRKALKFINQKKLKVVKSAHIIMKSNHNLESIAYIDAGSEDNIKEGDVVINSSGVVGRVIEASPTNSKILLITGHKSQIPCVFATSKVKAIVGGGHSGKLVVRISQQETPIEIGELILTSRDGDVVPEGLVIGKVTRKISDKEIEITPEFSVYNTDVVTVVSN